MKSKIINFVLNAIVGLFVWVNVVLCYCLIPIMIPLAGFFPTGRDPLHRYIDFLKRILKFIYKKNNNNVQDETNNEN